MRQIVLSTAGEDLEGLLRWRTEPLRPSIDAEAQLDDLGLAERYADAAANASRRESMAHEATLQACATAEEKARIAEISVPTTDFIGIEAAAEVERERAAERADEAWAIVTVVAERAQAAGGRCSRRGLDRMRRHR